MASSQAPYPSPLPKGLRLTPSAAPPFPTATLRRGLSCSFGAIHLHTSLVCGGNPVFPSRTLLETTQRGVLRFPPFGIPLGGWNGRRGAKDEGRGAAGDSGPALLRQTRSEPDSPAPALAVDALWGTGGYIGPLHGYPGSVRIRQSAGGGPMHQRHSFRKPNSVPRFGTSVMGIGPCKGRGNDRRGTEVRLGLPEAPGSPLPPRTKKDRPAGRSFLLFWAVHTSS